MRKHEMFLSDTVESLLTNREVASHSDRLNNATLPQHCYESTPLYQRSAGYFNHHHSQDTNESSQCSSPQK